MNFAAFSQLLVILNSMILMALHCRTKDIVGYIDSSTRGCGLMYGSLLSISFLILINLMMCLKIREIIIKNSHIFLVNIVPTYACFMTGIVNQCLNLMILIQVSCLS